MKTKITMIVRPIGRTRKRKSSLAGKRRRPELGVGMRLKISLE
jgi:hypothetical protein